MQTKSHQKKIDHALDIAWKIKAELEKKYRLNKAQLREAHKALQELIRGRSDDKDSAIRKIALKKSDAGSRQRAYISEFIDALVLCLQEAHAADH